MQAKLIEYAYPSSERATKAGYGKTGCWFVSLYANETTCTERIRILRYTGDMQGAINYAIRLPHPYNQMHKYFNDHITRVMPGLFKVHEQDHGGNVYEYQTGYVTQSEALKAAQMAYHNSGSVVYTWISHEISYC